MRSDRIISVQAMTERATSDIVMSRRVIRDGAMSDRVMSDRVMSDRVRSDMKSYVTNQCVSGVILKGLERDNTNRSHDEYQILAT